VQANTSVMKYKPQSTSLRQIVINHITTL